MTNHDPALLDTAVHNQCGLRVAFDWQTDRYAHQLIGLIDGNTIPLLASIEGSANERWPASPPFQQLSIEENAGGRIAFLVGMAGQSHWSASVQVAVDQPRVEFDIACLTREPALHLGSVYRQEAAPSSVDTGRITFSLQNDRSAKLMISSIENEPPSKLRSDRSQITISGGQLGTASSITHRWKYSIEIDREPTR